MAYSKRRHSHKKELYYILFIVALAVIFLFSFFGPSGYRDLQKQRLEVQAQRTRVEDLKQSNEERRRAIENLRSDREALERYAREKGYGRDDEIIQQLPKDPPKKSR
jgi:cell division protein FtsB